MKRLILIVAVLAAVAYFATPDPPDPVVPESIKRLMKYHGITTLYEDHAGRFFSHRNGKKIFVRPQGDDHEKA